MAALTVQSIVDAGTKPTFVAAALADTVPVGNGRDTFVVYKNTDASPKTIVVEVPGNTEYGAALPDPELTLAATNGELWIPLRTEYRSVDGDGRAHLSIKNPGTVTGVTVAVIRIA